MASSRVRSESGESGGESSSDQEVWRELRKESPEEQGPAETSGRVSPVTEGEEPAAAVGTKARKAARSSKGKLKGFKVPAAKEDPRSAVSSMNMAAIDRFRVDYNGRL
jgi:hypothetical protein